MINFFQSAILGLVQGLTEFIPVSSTGHLILFRNVMGLPLAGSLSFDAILQLATGFAILVYFSRDIWSIIKNKDFKLFWALVIGSIPAIILGLFLEKYMDTIFRGTHVVAYALILGAILFYFAERFLQKTPEILSTFNGGPNHSESISDVFLKDGLEEISEKSLERLGNPLSGKDLSGISLGKGLGIGFFQCLALIPGMSRSGSTISGGLFLGLNREIAMRFSFLLSLPIIFGSGLKKIWDLSQTGALLQIESSLYIASIFAFISGLLAIHFLLKFLKNHSLNYFGVYRIILAIIILIFL
jgi:undecaprenyl-diphosphatase